MKRRIYWLMPDLASARRAMRDLQQARVEVAHIHFAGPEGMDMTGLYLRTARSPMPTTTIDAAVMRRGPKPSFKMSVPMTAPKITLVSRNAVIGPSGRLLAAAR